MKIKYRREIDGLRAIAVLPVIFFHAGFGAFSGGFVGVDIFFVISGYLITSIILTEQEAGTFSLVNFYERRVRRILPALFVVMTACLPFAWIWMFPNELKDFSRSLMGVSVFASNILFWRESGYFVTASEMKPLLHTWSLAVEEQFYVFFPLFLVTVNRFGRRWLSWALFLAIVISLATAQWGSIYKPVPNFYLLPTRAWELLIGSLIALTSITSNQATSTTPLWQISLNQYGSLTGFLLILFSVVFFNRETPHPSFYTAIPVLGAAFVILFTTPANFVGRLLGSPIFVFLGSISYATYLWHQPLFAFARYRSINELSTTIYLGLILATLVLATISLYLVEKPFRDPKIVTRKKIFWMAFFGTLFFILVGAIWLSKSGIPGRFSSDLNPKFFPEKTNESTSCELTKIKASETIQHCFFGDVNSTKTVALYGDSHAQALFQELDRAFRAHSIRGLRVYMTNCEPIPNILTFSQSQKTLQRQSKECLKTYDSLLTYLRDSADAVIIGIRWTMRMYPIDGSVDELGFNNGEGGSERIEPRKYITLDLNGAPTTGGIGKKAAVDMLLRTMNELNKPVFVIHPIPEVGWDIPKYNFISYLNDDSISLSISTSHQRFKIRNHFINNILNNGYNYFNLIHIKPEHHLCNTMVSERCVAQWNGRPLYYDGDHLSNAGASIIAQNVMSHLSR